MSRRFQLAARSDDATLAQKRQYWRTKKREQRARLRCTQGKKLNPQCSAGSLNSKASSQPPVAVQGPPVVKVQHMAQISLRIQPKSSPAGADVVPVSPGAGVFAQPQDKSASAASQTGSKRCALTPSQRARGANKSQPSLETEERAARRREHWRIKKREQRAKLAARLKRREATLGVASGRQTPQQTGTDDATVLQGLASRGWGHKKHPDERPQLAGEGLAPVNSQQVWIKDEKPNGESVKQATVASDVSLRKKGAPQRKLPSYSDLSSSLLGIAQYRAYRQKFAEAQKNLMVQRNTRRKTALYRSVSKTEPNSTYEQIVAKQREYWRLKKREQRAKLSFNGKVRLKESYSKTIKLHHHLQEDKARLGDARVPVPDTIGGFIKEDGTVTVNVPARNADALKEVSENSFSKNPCQPNATWRVAPVQANCAPPPFHPPQVKAAVKRPQCRPPVRPADEPESAEVSHLHSAVQTVGTFIINPPTPQNGGLKLGGCVLKMVVSNAPPSAPPAVAGSTEKDRIARKREYWRLKKREQRAACAARVKLSPLQARTPEQLSLATNWQGGSQDGHFPDNSGQPTPNGSQIRGESESLIQCSQSITATSPFVQLPFQLPTSPKPHPAPQPEPGPALDAEQQTFHEESPEVAGSQIKAEPAEEGLEPEETADFTIRLLEENESFIDRHLKGESESSATPSPFPSSCEDDLKPACEHPSQNLVDFFHAAEPTAGPCSDDKARELFDEKASHQRNPLPEPSDLHHPPFDRLHARHCHEADPGQGQGASSPEQTFCSKGTKPSGLTGLMKQREYWKLMKRQQRARLKARKSAPRGESSNLLSPRNTQAPHLSPGPNPLPHQQTPLCFSAPDAASCSPMTHIFNPAPFNEQPPDDLQVQSPPSGFSCAFETSAREGLGPPPNQQQEGTSAAKAASSTDMDFVDASCFSVLEPPANPLCTLGLQPIAAPPKTPDRNPVPAEVPCARFPAAACAKPAPVNAMAPPKRTPGEREEDFLRRKREYWRIKKKEQRAKKAIQEKGITANRASTDAPSQNLQSIPTQGVSFSEESDHLISTLLDADAGSFPCYTAPVEDESEVPFEPSYDGEESPAPDRTWRSCYLMDYDPVNHLLVCIVCGEMQYPPNLTRVKAHIDEAHPDSLAMTPAERQQVLEAWDEEVSRRERFFTSQLQRHSGILPDGSKEDDRCSY